MIQLEGQSQFSNYPITSIPVGQEGLVHIWGQNNTSLKQKLGISWVIRDPDQLLVEQHTDDWSDFNISTGGTHEFKGGRFEFFKKGVYTIDVGLFMNPANPSRVDRYNGALCTVVPLTCSIDADCPPGYVCINGKCVLPPECSIDADCPSGYVCKDGICVPKEEEKGFPWIAAALIGGGAAIALAAATKKKVPVKKKA